MSRPAVSVVMAVHNGEPYVAATVESVLAQTYEDWEFIVIDDCSTDNTPEIVQRYGDPRVVYRRNDQNIGQTRSLNVGIELARAPLIARIDADDLFYPEKLARQMACMAADPSIAVLGTGAHVIDEDGRQTGLITSPTDQRQILFRLCRGVPVIHVTVIMRTEALKAVGCYDPTYRYSQDYALWSEFARAGYRIANVPDTLGAFRERSDSVNAVNKFGAALEETCRLTQRNTREFVGLELSLDECRAIDLLMFPAARLSTDEMIGAIDNLQAIAAGVWGRVPVRVRASLLARLVWAMTKRLEHGRRSEDAPQTRREVLRAARGNVSRPGVASAVTIAFVLDALGFDRVAGLKTVATRYLLR